MKSFLRQFFSRPTALFGFCIFAVILVIALAAPLIFSHGPFTIVGMPLLPPFGIETMGADYTGLARLGDVAEHMILPGVTLALYYLASYARLTRAAISCAMR